MSEMAIGRNDFVGYEYKTISATRETEAMYADGYENFGWQLDGSPSPQIGISAISMKFKRDRKIRNKAELTRLQRQFDSCIAEINSMEKSKAANATVLACMIGLLGTAFLAGATFAYLGGLIILCIILAVPGFVGWIVPYFIYNSALAKKAGIVAPLIEEKYDEAYEVCEKANSLL